MGKIEGLAGEGARREDTVAAILHLLRSTRLLVISIENAVRAALSGAGVLDLSPTHAIVLLTVSRAAPGPLTISDLEQMVGGSVRQSMKILTGRGYVITADDRCDGRITLVRPTRRGNEACARIAAQLAATAIGTGPAELFLRTLLDRYRQPATADGGAAPAPASVSGG